MQMSINLRQWDAYNDNIQNQMFCSYPVIYANQLYFYSISNICMLLNKFSFKYFCTLRPIIIWLQIFFEEKNLSSQFWFSCSSLQLEVKAISTQWMVCYSPWYKKRKNGLLLVCSWWCLEYEMLLPCLTWHVLKSVTTIWKNDRLSEWFTERVRDSWLSKGYVDKIVCAWNNTPMALEMAVRQLFSWLLSKRNNSLGEW